MLLRGIQLTFFVFIFIGCNKDIVGPYDCGSATDVRLLPNDLWDIISSGNECNVTLDTSVSNLFIVNSNDQYGFFISCIDEAPQIDFAKYTMLVGSENFDNLVKIQSQDILKDCGAKKYYYRIEVSLIEEGTPSVLYFVVLVPKIPSDYSAEIIIL